MVGEDLVTPTFEPRGVEVAADWATLKSIESYVGYEQAERFASPGGLADDSRVYTAPARLRLNQWSLAGDWTIQPQVAVLNTAGGRIAYRFHARDLNLAMGPTVRGGRVCTRPAGDRSAGGATAQRHS